MADPINEMARRARDTKLRAIEEAALQLVPCAADPGFRPKDCRVTVHDLGNIGGVWAGRVRATYNGEQVGPDVAWRVRIGAAA